MTTEAEQLMAAAMKKFDLRATFCPIELGSKIGLNKGQAELAARALSAAGVFVLGFDMAAHFSVDFRKSKSTAPKLDKSAKASLHRKARKSGAVSAKAKTVVAA